MPQPTAAPPRGVTPGTLPGAASRPARWLAIALVAVLALTLLPPAAAAQDEVQASSNQVTGLTAHQDDGAAILHWDPVPGAVSYEIERTLLEGDEGDTPAAPSQIVGLWRPDRTQWAISQPERPSFADSGFEPGRRYRWRVRPLFGGNLPFQVSVDAPSSAAGTYEAHGASFGPSPTAEGVSGEIALVDDGSANPTEGCDPLVGFPSGAIALVDRGGCTFVLKVQNAQAAGATAVIVVNNLASAPTNMGGTCAACTIPAVHIWRDDGDAIKAGLPATGTVSLPPVGDFSEPVIDNSLAPFGPQEFLTQFETSNATQWTSHANEVAFAEAVAAASDRMRIETIGHTLQGRRIDMYILGYPEPPVTAAQISRSPTVMLNCNVHGNEPSGREACLMNTRELAFSDDPWVIDMLSNATVLIVPAINGDGRANNTRGNASGQDLNRDHSLLEQPETFAFAQALATYTPDAVVDGHEFGNTNTGDLPLLWARHRAVAPDVADEAMAMIREFFFTDGADDGWWMVPYPYPSTGAGLGQETILRNTLGLKNMIGMLLESRVPSGPTRLAEGGTNSQTSRRRRVYSHLWTYRRFLDAHIERRQQYFDAIVSGRAFNTANEGPVFLNGSYDAPGGHPIPSPPTVVLDEAPCGYWLTPAQMAATPPPRANHPNLELETVGDRLAAHGIRVEDHDEATLVRMNQPLRGLIPLLLDPQATEAPLISGAREFTCPPPVCTGNVVLSGLDTGVADRPVDDTFCLSHLFDDEVPWPNNGAFVSHVASTCNALRAAGIINGREQGMLISAAGDSWDD